MTPPLAITGQVPGESATRVQFSDGSYTAMYMDGRVSCIQHAHIQDRTADRCCHVEAVRALSAAELEAVPIRRW